jgi:DNA ligase-1
MMLANPLNIEQDFDRLDPNDFQAEWKWDGIRVQAVFDESNKQLYSRTGDDISRAFPDIVGELNGKAVLDGELLVGENFKALPFNQLQQRLNRKSPTKMHLKNYPAFIRVYDMLFYNEDDIRDLPLKIRRQKLEDWMKQVKNSRLDISEILDFDSWSRLAELRTEKADTLGHEGVMIKDLQSKYSPGRPKGPWFKWKRDPKFLDGVMMYAQRGHGRRSSFYSDYTFGIWRGNELVPIGKAYSGFTDEELVMLDKWVRGNTLNRFGPVREVRKELVVELAFDSAHASSRHKSGIALRFPRINRIRWDKPAQEADTTETITSIM